MTPDKSATYRSLWSHMMTTPFRQGYLTAGGLRTRYVEAGEPDLPPLVLLHGTGGHWEAFCANIGPLSEHFHVFAPDMMGCGFTDKPDQPYEVKDYVAHVTAFMDAVGVPRADFIGVSLGAWVCTRLALAHPQRAGRMILVAPTGYYPVSPAKVLARLYHDPAKSLVDDMVAVRHRVYSLPNMKQIMPRLLTLFDPETRLRNNLSDDEWRRIESPVLLIENVDSDDVYLKTARTVVNLLPRARLHPMTEVSHWAQFEKPDEFNQVALAFLREA
jgi:2-hydroxy-6-oxonona-2,4-dienedioate hydrolase